MKLRLSIAAALAAVVVAGCGGGDDTPDTAPPASSGGDGAKVFADNCSTCHTLAAAGATGKVGPDLDQLRPGPDLVKAQTENGGGAMPAFKGKLTPEQIQAVANYVADNAGKGL